MTRAAEKLSVALCGVVVPHESTIIGFSRFKPAT